MGGLLEQAVEQHGLAGLAQTRSGQLASFARQARGQAMETEDLRHEEAGRA